MLVDTEKTMKLIKKIGDGIVIVSEEAKVLNNFIQMEFAFIDSIAIFDPEKKEKIFEKCQIESDKIYDDLIKNQNEKIVIIASMLKARALVGEWVDFLPKKLISTIKKMR